MIGARMLYLIQKESEMTCGFGSDVAYCIAGKQIRIPTPNGTKIFIEKEQAAALVQPQPNANDELIQKMTQLEKRIQKLESAPKQSKIAF